MNKNPKKFDNILKEMKINDPYYNGYTYYNDILSRHIRLSQHIKITHSKKSSKNPRE